MTRKLSVALAAAAVVALSASAFTLGSSNVAVVAPAEAAAKHKMCKSRTPAGKLKTWRCGTNQACCVSHELGLYVCGFAGMGSLGCI